MNRNKIILLLFLVLVGCGRRTDPPPDAPIVQAPVPPQLPAEITAQLNQNNNTFRLDMFDTVQEMKDTETKYSIAVAQAGGTTSSYSWRDKYDRSLNSPKTEMMGKTDEVQIYCQENHSGRADGLDRPLPQIETYTEDGASRKYEGRGIYGYVIQRPRQPLRIRLMFSVYSSKEDIQQGTMGEMGYAVAEINASGSQDKYYFTAVISKVHKPINPAHDVPTNTYRASICRLEAVKYLPSK